MKNIELLIRFLIGYIFMYIVYFGGLWIGSMYFDDMTFMDIVINRGRGIYIFMTITILYPIVSLAPNMYRKLKGE